MSITLNVLLFPSVVFSFQVATVGTVTKNTLENIRIYNHQSSNLKITNPSLGL